MRWHAVVYYRTEAGKVDVEHDFDEIVDLEQAIEAGPSFLAIDRIVITYQGCAEQLTVEEAERA
jgi:hypothetical protein